MTKQTIFIRIDYLEHPNIKDYDKDYKDGLLAELSHIMGSEDKCKISHPMTEEQADYVSYAIEDNPI